MESLRGYDEYKLQNDRDGRYAPPEGPDPGGLYEMYGPYEEKPMEPTAQRTYHVQYSSSSKGRKLDIGDPKQMPLPFLQNAIKKLEASIAYYVGEAVPKSDHTFQPDGDQAVLDAMKAEVAARIAEAEQAPLAGEEPDSEEMR